MVHKKEWLGFGFHLWVPFKCGFASPPVGISFALGVVRSAHVSPLNIEWGGVPVKPKLFLINIFHPDCFGAHTIVNLGDARLLLFFLSLVGEVFCCFFSIVKWMIWDEFGSMRSWGPR